MIGRSILTAIVVVLVLIINDVTAFAPKTITTATTTPNAQQQIFTFQQAHVVVPSTIIRSASCINNNNNNNKRTAMIRRHLSSTEPENSDVEKTAAAVSTDGTYYDDEVEPAVIKVGISDTMKERLQREASTGLDADAPQQNVILYIILGVSILVLLGGKDIFY